MKITTLLKSTLFLISIICCNKTVYSQTDIFPVSVTKLTEIMIQKKYTANEIQELKTNPEKLKIINYLYSKSFEVSEYQKISAEQFEKIDISIYDLKRKLDERVLVFDEASGLSLILYSLNQIESDTQAISKSAAQTNHSSNKISN